MALRTNSKKAIENIREYIVYNYDGTGYTAGTPEAEAATFEEIASVIYADVVRVYGYLMKRFPFSPFSTAFKEYAQGLPGLIDTCYYYNRSAVADLAEILEETPEEAGKYREDQAEELLTVLLAREILKGAKK